MTHSPDSINDTELTITLPCLSPSEYSHSSNQGLTYSDPPSVTQSDPTLLTLSDPPPLVPSHEASLTQSDELSGKFLNKTSNSSSPDSAAGDRICLVCGDRANGVHYNVLSCEGCKSFFLRNVKQRDSLECIQGGRCEMDLYTRRHCPACRMKRCLECGMNIERVWDKKRLKTRKPLIRTKRKKKRPGVVERVSQSSPGSLPPAPLTDDQSELLDRLEKGYYASTDLFRNITRGIPEKFVNFWTQATSIGSTSSSTTVTQSAQSSDEQSSSSKVEESTTNLDLVQQAIKSQSEGKGLPSIHKVTQYLTNGCSSSVGNGVKANLPEHSETVHKEMLHLAMDMFATVVKQTIHFAKNIPGFTDLTCDDQAVLIKSSIVDALLLRCTESFELEKGYLENPFNGDKFDIHMMYYLGFSALPEPAFEFMRTTKACGLSKAEFALLTAVAIIAPDRSDLKNRDLAERIQSLLISTLYSATKHFHPDKPLLFAHLMSKLTTLRDMSVLHLSELMEYRIREADLSPLVVELFGLDS